MSPEVLFSQLWENTLRASVLIVLVGLLRAWLRPLIGPRCFQWIWLIVVVRFLLPVDLTSTWSAENLVPTSVSSTPLIPARLDFAHDVTTRQPTAVSIEDDLPVLWSFGDMVLTVWIIGVLGILAMVAVSHSLFWRRVRRDAQEADAPLSGLMIDLAKSLRIHPIPVFQTSAVTSPAVAGLFRPQILLPRDMVSRVSPQELRLILLHELGHLKRHDLWKHFFMLLAVAVHWFNPFAWLALRFAREDSELACDAFVLDSTPQTLADTYDQTLLHLLTLSRSNRTAITTLGILENTKQIEHRMKMIHSYKPMTLTRAVFGGALILITTTAFLTSGHTAGNSVSETNLITIRAKTLDFRGEEIPEELKANTITLSDEQLRAFLRKLDPGDKGSVFEVPDLTVAPGKPQKILIKGQAFDSGANSSITVDPKVKPGHGGVFIDISATPNAAESFDLKGELSAKGFLGWSSTPDGKTPVSTTSSSPRYPIFKEIIAPFSVRAKPSTWTITRMKDIILEDGTLSRQWLMVRAESVLEASIAAIVNGRAIPASHVDDLAETYSKQKPGTSSESKEMEKKRALQNIIDQQLILQDFENRNLSIPDDIVNDVIIGIAKREFDGDEKALRAALDKQGYTWDDLFQKERNKIIVLAMRNKFFGDEKDPNLRAESEKQWIQGLREKAKIEIISQS